MFVIPATGSAKLISKTCCKNSRAGSHTRRLISTNFAAIAPVRYIREVADFLEFQQDLLLHVFAVAVQQLFLGGEVVVDGGIADLRLLGNFAHGGGFEAFDGDHIHRRFEDAHAGELLVLSVEFHDGDSFNRNYISIISLFLYFYNSIFIFLLHAECLWGVDYRCLFFINAHGSATWFATRRWFAAAFLQTGG